MNCKELIWKSLLGEKHLLRKSIHFSVKNTANNVDIWGFIQQFFQLLYRWANSFTVNSTFRKEGPARQQNSLRDLLPIQYFPLSVGNSNV